MNRELSQHNPKDIDQIRRLDEEFQRQLIQDRFDTLLEYLQNTLPKLHEQLLSMHLYSKTDNEDVDVIEIESEVGKYLAMIVANSQPESQEPKFICLASVVEKWLQALPKNWLKIDELDRIAHISTLYAIIDHWNSDEDEYHIKDPERFNYIWLHIHSSRIDQLLCSTYLEWQNEEQIDLRSLRNNLLDLLYEMQPESILLEEYQIRLAFYNYLTATKIAWQELLEKEIDKTSSELLDEIDI